MGILSGANFFLASFSGCCCCCCCCFTASVISSGVGDLIPLLFGVGDVTGVATRRGLARVGDAEGDERVTVFCATAAATELNSAAGTWLGTCFSYGDFLILAFSMASGDTGLLDAAGGGVGDLVGKVGGGVDDLVGGVGDFVGIVGGGVEGDAGGLAALTANENGVAAAGGVCGLASDVA